MPNRPTTPLAAIQDGFENGTGFRRQCVGSDFLFGPDQDAVAQAVRLDEAFHEFGLVDAGGEKVAGELRECLFAQVAPMRPAAAQQQAAGTEAQPCSPLFEALKIRAGEDAARQGTGIAEAAHRGPDMAWDQEWRNQAVGKCGASNDPSLWT